MQTLILVKKLNTKYLQFDVPIRIIDVDYMNILDAEFTHNWFISTYNTNIHPCS